MNARILVLTAGYGEGHNAAARALASAFDRAGGAGSARIADVFALASPRINAVTRRLYLRLINDAPVVWSRVYRWIDESDFVQRHLRIFRREIEVLAGLIDREQPSAICCTYPLYAFFLQAIARRRGAVPPVYNVVTDSISINSLWWRAACDGWFLPNADSAEVLLRAGVPAAAVHVCGFPVPAFFRESAGRYAPPSLAGGARPRVLHLVHSGTRQAEAIARHLMADTDWEITCAVGRDERLRARLARMAADRPHRTEVLGWTDQIPRLLMTHHALVSKVGGATTQEAIAALCPMIVSQIVPGQEEGNYELLRRHQSGALATTPEAVVAVLRAAFAGNGRGWQRWHAALRPLALPHAADNIARHILDRAAARSMGVEKSPESDSRQPQPGWLSETAAPPCLP